MEKTIGCSGYTLIQLVIVIIILSILAITFIFKWSNTSFSLGAQAALLANDIRYTQSLAITQNQRFSLVINTSTKSYQIQNELNQPVTISTRGNTIYLSNNISFGVITTITNKIIFNTKGIPYDDYPVTPLTQTATISLTSRGQTQTITIYPETGRVTP